MEVLAIIPARFHSSRLPGKPLANIAGKTMIQRVYESAMACKRIKRVIVATDDSRIKDCVIKFGGEACMTSEMHESGTDRCAEVSKKYPEFEFVLNVQGDEPIIDRKSLDNLIELLISDKSPDIATLRFPVNEISKINDPNLVKIVCDKKGRCLYFSRAVIPYSRNHDAQVHFKHLGIYGFRKKVLWEISSLKPTQLEQTEKLEQLRWLENGYSIFAMDAEKDSFGIDTLEDLNYLNDNWTILIQ